MASKLQAGRKTALPAVDSFKQLANALSRSAIEDVPEGWQTVKDYAASGNISYERAVQVVRTAFEKGAAGGVACSALTLARA